MTCDRIDLLMGWLEDELDLAERREVEAHLEGCAACQAQLESFRGLSQDLGRLEPEQPSQAARDQAYQAVLAAMATATAGEPPVALRDAGGSRPPSGLLIRILQGAAAAACLVIVVTIGALPDGGPSSTARAPQADAPGPAEVGDTSKDALEAESGEVAADPTTADAAVEDQVGSQPAGDPAASAPEPTLKVGAPAEDLQDGALSKLDERRRAAGVAETPPAQPERAAGRAPAEAAPMDADEAFDDLAEDDVDGGDRVEEGLELNDGMRPQSEPAPQPVAPEQGGAGRGGASTEGSRLGGREGAPSGGAANAEPPAPPAVAELEAEAGAETEAWLATWRVESERGVRVYSLRDDGRVAFSETPSEQTFSRMRRLRQDALDEAADGAAAGDGEAPGADYGAPALGAADGAQKRAEVGVRVTRLEPEARKQEPGQQTGEAQAGEGGLVAAPSVDPRGHEDLRAILAVEVGLPAASRDAGWRARVVALLRALGDRHAEAGEDDALLILRAERQLGSPLEPMMRELDAAEGR